MKKLIKFTEDEGAYIFTCDGSEESLDGDRFAISKDNLVVDVERLYSAFFKGLEEKPEFSFSEPENMDKTAKHVYQTVTELIDSASEKIKEEWFQTSSCVQQDGESA